MVFVIVILYMSTSVYVAIEWSFTQYVFVKNGETFVTIWDAWTSGTSTPWLVYHWSSGFTSGLTTSIADGIMVCHNFWKFIHFMKNAECFIRSGAAGLFGVVAMKSSHYQHCYFPLKTVWLWVFLPSSS